jgi:tetratricopeptide (TPR) repeat protein
VNPRSYVARTLLGRTLLLQPTPDLETVRSLYLEAIDIAPQRVRAYCDLALLDRKQGRHFAALTQYQHAAGLDPQFAEAHHGIAQSLVSLGRRDEALAAYRRTLELEPGFAIGWFNMSLALRDNGDNEAAIGALRRAVELAPQMRQAHQELVRLLIVEGRADEVIAEFELELAAAPHDALLHDRFAVALMQLARYDEALVEVERAIELEPRDLTPRRHRAAILLRKGEIAEALEQLRWIDARQPGSPAALDLAWTLATHPAAQWRDGAEAVRLANSYGAQTNYADPRGNDVLAAAYAESGDFARAVELAGQALQSASDGGHVELADEIEARLVLYRQGLPYRSAPVP